MLFLSPPPPTLMHQERMRSISLGLRAFACTRPAQPLPAMLAQYRHIASDSLCCRHWQGTGHTTSSQSSSGRPCMLAWQRYTTCCLSAQGLQASTLAGPPVLLLSPHQLTRMLAHGSSLAPRHAALVHDAQHGPLCCGSLHEAGMLSRHWRRSTTPARAWGPTARSRPP